MKKFLLVAALAVSSLGASAQNKPSYGIVGNLNLSRIHTSVDMDNMSASGRTGMLPSFSAGFFGDFTVANNVSIRPSLLYSVKGGKETEDNVPLKLTISYLELPLDVVFHAPTKAGVFQFGFGPYIGYGLSAKVSAKQDGMSVSQDIGFGDTEGTFSRVDAGLNLLVGLRLQNRLMINLGSDLGITNLSNAEGVKSLNQTATIGIGYVFK